MWLIVLSWCASAILVMSLAFCLCWRKKSTAPDWQGLDGMVIQKNPDENVNHLPSVTVNALENAVGDTDSNKRNTISTRRSLPDIPADQSLAPTYEPIVDNSSGHYATVGQCLKSDKRSSLPNGNVLKPIGLNDTEKPYERVKYDQMKVKEHPYAQLQPTTSRAGIFEESESEENTNLLRHRVEDVNCNDLVASARSRRSSAHSNIEQDNNIHAAPAVAGVLAASPELPYMTPPLNQANFSGDSQDSSKGYTSISVREPLANIIDQTKKAETNKRAVDPHYSTLSDDSSDDVYTTIPDPKNPIYTSESETYACIESLQITVEAEINHSSAVQAASAENTDELYELPPENPVSTVDTSKPKNTHSRQASSSSSVANIGSPKPEKRQANSPLPPPPIVNTFDAHSDKAVKNLDEMYAKVHKNKKEDEEVVPFRRTRSGRSLTGTSLSGVKIEADEIEEHNYETLKSRRTSDPAYEKIKGDEPGYASINRSESMTGSDPGYEVLKSKALSEADPNYEELRHKVSNASDFSGYSKIRDLMDGYSVVNKAGRKSTNSSLSYDGEEPNYESMPSDVNTINNNNESDPKYETVDQVSKYRKKSYSDSDENVWKIGLERGQKTGRGSTGSSSSSKKSLPDNRITSRIEDNNPSGSDNYSDPNLGVVDENGIIQI